MATRCPVCDGTAPSWDDHDRNCPEHLPRRNHKGEAVSRG